MVYLLSAILNGLATFLTVKFWDSFFPRREVGVMFWGRWFLGTAILTISMNLIPFNWNIVDPVKVLVEMAVFYGINVALFHGKWPRRVFVVVTGYACLMSIGVMVEAGGLFISNFTRQEYVYNIPFYMLLVVVNWSLVALFVLAVHRIHPLGNIQESPISKELLGIFIPICTFFVIFFAQTASEAKDVWLFCLVLISAMDMMILLFSDHLESSAQLHKALAVACQRADVQAAGIQALSASYKTQRKMTHEFRSHLSVLSDYLSRKDITGAQKYLEALKVQQTERILLVNTHNPLIDAILNQKGSVAQEKKIDLRFQINDLSKVNIPPAELTVVMENLLDNAIEACEKLPEKDRWISVKALHERNNYPGTFFFSVENACLPVTIINDSISSTKPDPELHGFGLPNVMDILKKREAIHVMKYNNGTFLFCTEFPNAGNDV